MTSSNGRWFGAPPVGVKPESTLREKLASLRRDDLAGADLAVPGDLSFIDALAFVPTHGRVMCGSERSKSPSAATPLPLIAGMHSGAVPCIAVLVHEPPVARLAWGIQLAAKDALSDHLAGEFGRPGLGPAVPGSAIRAALRKYSFAGALTGTPGLPPEDGGLPAPPMQKLCEGLGGEPFALLLVAYPMPASMTVDIVQAVARELQQIDETVLLRDGMREHDQLAQVYRRLLEQTVERFSGAHSFGLWQAGTYVLAHTPGVVSRGLALLVGALTTTEPVVQPLRTHRCRADESLPDARSMLLTSEELALSVRPPERALPGFFVDRSPGFVAEVASPRGATVRMGTVIHDGTETSLPFVLERDALSRHMLVCGTTGSGKTTTCAQLLRELWNPGDRRSAVPFLVLEPAKAEYRDLLLEPGMERLRVYTAGSEATGRSAPLRFNPFYFPARIHPQTHVDLLKAAFQAAFVLYPPMPYVLEAALHEVYARKGWDLATGENHRGHGVRAFPTLAEFADVVDEIVVRAGYSDKIESDVRAGLRVRLTTLRTGAKGGMLDVPARFTLDPIFDGPAVIELQALGSEEDRVFVMALLLVALHEHCISTRPRGLGGQLAHVTLLEEAHRLLRAPRGGSEDGESGGRTHAVETFANLLSEMRGYGEGFIVAEQIPTKLISDVVKNSATKIVHRLLAEDDRAVVGATMGLGRKQLAQIARLGPGTAIVNIEAQRSATQVRIAAPAHDRAIATDERLAHAMAERHPEAGRNPHVPSWYGEFVVELGNACRSARVLELDRVERAIDAFVLVLLGGGDVASAREEVWASARVVSATRPGLTASEVMATATVVLAIDKGVERRGGAYRWPHEELDGVCSALWGAVLGRDHERTALGVLSRRLTSPRGPYVGCRACGRPCAYRYEVERVVRRSGRMSELDAALAGDADLYESGIAAGRSALSRSLRMVSPPDAGIIFCLLVVDAHTRGIRSDRQLKYARNIAHVLGDGRGEELQK